MADNLEARNVNDVIGTLLIGGPGVDYVASVSGSSRTSCTTAPPLPLTSYYFQARKHVTSLHLAVSSYREAIFFLFAARAIVPIVLLCRPLPINRLRPPSGTSSPEVLFGIRPQPLCSNC